MLWLLSFSTFFSAVAYPNLLACDRLLQEGESVMGQSIVQSSDRVVTVRRGNVNLPDGAFYIPGESLSVELSGSGGQYIFEVQGALSKGDYCQGKRRIGSGKIQLPDSDASPGPVTIFAAWASRYGRVSLTPVLTLLPAPATVMIKYDLIDVTANSFYAGGNVEYHCFDPHQSGAFNFVRGTYGRFGYFEGMVDDENPQVFHVNWYESSIDGASVGAATLTYSPDFSSVEGPFWSSSDIIGSYNHWHSVNGSNVDLSTSSPNELLREHCLYPGAVDSSPRTPNVFPKTITGQGPSGLNQFCNIPVRPEDYLGAYQYVYDDASVEEGTYGRESRSFAVSTGFGFTGSWHAHTGPFAGDSGTVVYISQRSNQVGQFIVGFFCTVEEVTPGVFERTECTKEYYTALKRRDAASIDICPQYFSKEEPNLSIPLRKFARLVELQ